MSPESEFGGTERVATIDIGNYEILAAISEPGCALCRVEALAETRMVQAFLREGRYTPEARDGFRRSGGFCRRHAWQLHTEATREGTGAGIADVYTQLTKHDLVRLEHTAAKLETRRGRRDVRRSFRRRTRCQLCARLARAGEAHGYFLGQLLGDEQARDAFHRGDGLCSPHLELAVREALRADEDGRVAAFLVRDWHERLEALVPLLAEYDRKRDYRHASEPRGEEQGSWTEVVRRYVGEPPQT